MLHIAPSILAADFSRLGEQVRAVEAGGADRIHIDVMDGHFVPNLSMGAVVVQGLRPITKLNLEVHLMVEKPQNFIEGFLKAGANSIIVHDEVVPDPTIMAGELKQRGVRFGVAINPNTPINRMKKYLANLDLALCMTVYPGFGGQKFLPDSPSRIEALHALIQQLNPQCELEVDGGIDFTTAPVAINQGANVLVAGTAIFADDRGPTVATAELLKLKTMG